MKTLISTSTVCALILTAFVFSGCGSSNKTTKSKNSSDAYLNFEDGKLSDLSTALTWEFYHDNPTTVLRYKMNEVATGNRFPTRDELQDLLQKVSAQSGQKKGLEVLNGMDWFAVSSDYISSTTRSTDEGETLYKICSWNSEEKTIEEGEVTSGDLISILLVKE